MLDTFKSLKNYHLFGFSTRIIIINIIQKEKLAKDIFVRSVKFFPSEFQLLNNWKGQFMD